MNHCSINYRDLQDIPQVLIRVCLIKIIPVRNYPKTKFT